MPFDEFTLQQLAGDLIPGTSEQNRIATGFHRNTQINQEGGIDPEQFRVDSVFDRVATTGTVWLGLTIGCAQCHDHKVDRITQQEYYRVFAFFNNQEEPALKVYGPGVDVAALTEQFRAAEKELAALLANRADELAAWESSLSDEDKQKAASRRKDRTWCGGRQTVFRPKANPLRRRTGCQRSGVRTANRPLCRAMSLPFAMNSSAGA